MLSTNGMGRDAGLWGARGGMPFDDGVNSKVNKVSVHLGESSQVLYGVKFEYTHTNGQLISSPIHGGKDGDIIKEITLDGIEEYLTGISGFYGPVERFDGIIGITSITFHTNKKSYGPFGKESGGEGCVHFTTSSPGKVLGFFGRETGILKAIGVHMKYF